MSATVTQIADRQPRPDTDPEPDYERLAVRAFAEGQPQWAQAAALISIAQSLETIAAWAHEQHYNR